MTELVPDGDRTALRWLFYCGIRGITEARGTAQSHSHEAPTAHLTSRGHGRRWNRVVYDITPQEAERRRLAEEAANRRRQLELEQRAKIDEERRRHGDERRAVLQKTFSETEAIAVDRAEDDASIQWRITESPQKQVTVRASIESRAAHHASRSAGGSHSNDVA